MNNDTIQHRRWFTLAVLSLSLFVIVLDNTILNVGLPTLARELSASGSELQWIVDAYVLVFAGALLTAGSLGDRFGRRRALIAGLAVFGTGSVLAALSQSAGQLITVRAVMGVGGAFVMPSTLSILTNVFNEEERPKAIAAWSAVAGLGIVAGPTIGGWLLEHSSWHMLFLVNVPVVALAITLDPLLVPESRAEDTPRLDPVGSLLSIAALATVLYAIIEAPGKGWTSSSTAAFLAVGIVELAALVLWELRSDHPMLDMRFFRNMRFTAASLSMTLVYFALMGTLFYLTQQLQLVEGYSALQAGIRLAPVALALAVAAPVAAQLTRLVGARIAVAGGLAIVAVGLTLFATNLSDTSGYTTVVTMMLVCGFGMGLAMTPATDSIMGSLPKERAGVGSAINDTSRQVGAAMGVAVLGSVLSSIYASNMASHVASLPVSLRSQATDSIGSAFRAAASLDPHSGGALMSAARHAFVSGETQGVLVAAGIALFGSVLAFAFLPARAQEPETRTEATPVLAVARD